MIQPSDSGRAGPAPPETPVFAATLRPHRSLGRKGTAIVVGAVALASLLVSMPFVVMGAWPVGGFFGLDVALVYMAFRISNRNARAYEEIFLSRVELVFRKVNWRGASREWRFNPRWVRLKAEKDADYGLLRLAIAERRREVAIADCLGPAERADFARAFDRALAEARR
jgi:uncharacterized membrane protein